MKFFKWLYPGMGIKRWILLCGVGISIILVIALYSIKIFSQTSILLATFFTSLLILGIFLIITAIKNILRTFVRALMPKTKNEEELVNIVYEKRQERVLKKGPRVVAIGGGTGLSVLLQGLKNHTNNITAIVTVTDNGGSSGILRDEFDMLPPGDIRNCLVALADAEPLMGKLFQYRFEDGVGLKGHSFGNLFITALSKITGDFDRAIKESSKVLAIRGRVIPSTLEHVSLVAEFEDGKIVEGETNITDLKKPIKQIKIMPENCEATKEAVEALENADLIIMGPGSLYTSILPNLLIKEIKEKVINSDAIKVYVSNIMTQPGETDNFTSEGHLKTLIKHTNENIVDVCIINNGNIPNDLLEKYKTQGSFMVPLDIEKIEALGCDVVANDVVNVDTVVRHDPDKLAKVIFNDFISRKEKQLNI